MLQLTRRGSEPTGDSATRITGIALGLFFFVPRRGIVCLWTEISHIWHPDATLIKPNARGITGGNHVSCNRITHATVYNIPPAPPGDSVGQKIALIATGDYSAQFLKLSVSLLTHWCTYATCLQQKECFLITLKWQMLFFCINQMTLCILTTTGLYHCYVCYQSPRENNVWLLNFVNKYDLLYAQKYVIRKKTGQLIWHYYH